MTDQNGLVVEVAFVEVALVPGVLVPRHPRAVWLKIVGKWPYISP